MNKKLMGIITSLTVVAMFAACGAKEETPETPGTETPGTETPGTEAPAGEELEGSVIVDGSGTVYPLMANIAENYMVNEQPGVSVHVGRAGSSAGLKKFIAG